MRIAIVGAGISGLTAAHRALELRPDADVVVFEASSRSGGAIATERTDGLIIERGPDSILSDKPAALDLVRRLGIEDEVVGTNPENRGAYVVCRGRLERIPPGFSLMAPLQAGPFLKSPVLSWPGKARAALDLVLPRGSNEESLEAFVRRRFGEELYSRLAQPLVGGIYGADPSLLSLRETMPRFVDAEATHRSVSLGLLREQRRAGPKSKASGARYGLFVNFRKGMQQLTDRLEEAVGERLQLKTSVRSIRKTGGGFELVVERSGTETKEHADRVLLALPAHIAATTIEGFDGLSARLSRIPYGSAVTATLAYRREDIPHPLDAYGFVVPTVEGRAVLASTWLSRKWPGRAPEGLELIRVFVGGVVRADAV
ncbi:MAG: protoporphyrinogen oxidase, partial [Myxococcota bacterium]